MKKNYFTLFIAITFAYLGYSQTIPPPYINYQAVLYDVNGPNPNAVLANQSFATYVNIQDELGNLLYKEEHYASTDANGQITVKIGDGVYLQGPITNFNQINWGAGKYYLIVDFDINGTISSTAPEQLVTVPYTFYAGKAGNGMTAVADNGNGTLTFTYANGQTYITPTLSGIQGPIGPAGPQGPQGVPGPQGANGVAGANGLNALIKTNTEPAGANCANGGTKIETGLDANANGVLDAGEVNGSQTKYVCDGNGVTNSEATRSQQILGVTPIGSFGYSHPGWRLLWGSIQASIPAMNNTTYFPIYIAKTTTFSGVVIHVAGASNTVGALLRAGIYSWNNGYPDQLIRDYGTMSMTTVGLKTINSSITLTPGYYFLTVVGGSGNGGSCYSYHCGEAQGPVSTTYTDLTSNDNGRVTLVNVVSTSPNTPFPQNANISSLNTSWMAIPLFLKY